MKQQLRKSFTGRLMGLVTAGGICATAWVALTPASAAAESCQDWTLSSEHGHAYGRHCGGHVHGVVHDDKRDGRCVAVRVFWADGDYADSKAACLHHGTPKVEFEFNKNKGFDHAELKYINVS
jgi:hypothetical protein